MTKKNYHLTLLFWVLLAACTSPRQEKLINYVNPFIGTDEDGHTFPGAIVPFGMVQLSPDNGNHGYNWCSGYHYSSTTISGFSHTHYSGTGAESLCDISLFPLADAHPTWESVRSDFSHQEEKATPGYYRVLLKSSAIQAELTTTIHCGMHRYIFPESQSRLLRIDLGFGNGNEARVGHNGDEPLECYLRRMDDHTVVGYRRSMGFVGDHTVYFAARTQLPVSSLTLFADGEQLPVTDSVRAVRVNSYLHFPGSKLGDTLMVKVAISSAGVEGALAGLQEIPDWNFDRVKGDAEAEWEKELQKIVVTTTDSVMKQIFYTAVYHNYFAPFRYDDAASKYRGGDQQIHSGKDIYTLNSLWDTFRATAPLFTITQTRRVPAMIRSYLDFYRQHGLLPSWELYFNEANVMPGYHAVPIIADAILKGIGGFDYHEAFEAMKVTANENIRESDYYRQYGYVPDDRDPRKRGVTKSVEYAFDDWCIAQVARKLNKEADYAEFLKRSGYWKNVFDPETGFVRPKDSNGSWMVPFDPSGSTGFQEGNSWIYTWYVPQDVKGLIAAMGGADAFEKKLDSLYNGPEKPYRDLKNHGFYGLSEFSNEPSHHVPYLYNYIGRPSKTVDKVHHILTRFYNNQPNGLCGNDDCGQTSAWYVFSAMGLYPVNPACGEYVIGSPIAERFDIRMENQALFSIKAENLSEQNRYVQKATLNGKPYSHTFLKHSDLAAGGELVLTMGSAPSASWGRDPKDYPGSEERP